MSERIALEPVRRLWQRFETDRTESDLAGFLALLYMGEFITKLTAITLAASVSEQGRERYTLEYQLVRADGIGEWGKVIDEVVIGPTHDRVRLELRPVQRQLTERAEQNDWRSGALQSLERAIDAAIDRRERQQSPRQLRLWFHHLALLRNKTRGHGAMTSTQCSNALPHLLDSLNLMAENFELLKLDWAFIRRNLSGKHRVVCFGGDPSAFDVWKKGSGKEFLDDGVYAYANGPIPLKLLRTDVDLSDFLVPNGGYSATKFEFISHITNSRADGDSTQYQSPPDPLPKSETHGRSELEPVGSCLTNVPGTITDYIRRKDLEDEVVNLLTNSRHAVITLQGPGGAGKTSLALASIHRILTTSTTFESCIWFSARDVDLTEHGPKPVAPAATSIDDFSLEFVRLTEGGGGGKKKNDARAKLSQALSSPEIGSTLFAFDNFETVDDPGSVYRWIDERIRPPNKVIITTRVRDFSGDMPVIVSGMNLGEAKELINASAKRLGIQALLSGERVEEVFEESAGHPYAIKIMLGEIAGAGRWVKPDRILAGQDKLLDALFERTYSRLSPGAQFVFTVLSAWRSVVPEVALEVAVLMHSKERFEVSPCIAELERLSIVDIVRDESGRAFVSLPLTASAFGQKKLQTSSNRTLAEACLETIRLFGATRRDGLSKGVAQSLVRFFSEVERRLKEGKLSFESVRKALEYCATEHPPLWLKLEEMYQLSEPSDEVLQSRADCLRRFLESSPEPGVSAQAWQRLAYVLRDLRDYDGEILAYSQVALVPGAGASLVSEAANKLNNALLRIRNSAAQPSLTVDTKRAALGRIVERLESLLAGLDADDISRLAWSYLSLGNEGRARECALLGLEKSPQNEHCRRILQRLGGVS